MVERGFYFRSRCCCQAGKLCAQHLHQQSNTALSICSWRSSWPCGAVSTLFIFTAAHLLVRLGQCQHLLLETITQAVCQLRDCAQRMLQLPQGGKSAQRLKVCQGERHLRLVVAIGVHLRLQGWESLHMKVGRENHVAQQANMFPPTRTCRGARLPTLPMP